MNLFNIEKSFQRQMERGWEKTFWFVDVHDTICRATYEQENVKEILKVTDTVSLLLDNDPTGDKHKSQQLEELKMKEVLSIDSKYKDRYVMWSEKSSVELGKNSSSKV